jgi:hypothetical protein
MRPQIGIIGAGIFGLAAALELSKFCDVFVYERNSDLLSEATTNNMLRHHMGYHYPRSDETVKEIQESAPFFEEEFKECIVGGFPAYYSVSKIDSWSTGAQFLDFCKRHKLPYEIVDAPDWLLDKSRIELCVKTPEAVYDPEILKDILKKRIDMSKHIHVFLNSEIVGAKKQGSQKTLLINDKMNSKRSEANFDIVVNATYSHFNTFNKWFGFPTPILQYDLMEILEISLPIKERFGMLILDGKFATILPKGKKDTYTLGNVNHTMIHRTTTEFLDDIQTTRKLPSNKEKILGESAKLMPFLKSAKYIRSLYSTRVVKANLNDDARPTEITDLGDGLYSIFAGKVITSAKTAKDLAKIIKSRI